MVEQRGGDSVVGLHKKKKNARNILPESLTKAFIYISDISFTDLQTN